MPTRGLHKPKPAPRTGRSDGVQTRAQLLQVAGRVFADRGFARATSRDICVAAGTNMAAVNYHFGSKGGLYDAVLVEAHGQLIHLDELLAISRAELDPHASLRALIELFVRRTAGPHASWGLTVLVHELMAPSAHVPALMQQAVLPKVRVMMHMLAKLLGVAENDAVVQRALAFVVLPCIMLLIAPPVVLRHALPSLASAPEVLIDDMACYALAGITALGAQHGRPLVGIKVKASVRNDVGPNAKSSVKKKFKRGRAAD
jgi:TetR/AcrR family transcriptional regulator, regulator of cefoperazone and chloramphenicol sensitivity